MATRKVRLPTHTIGRAMPEIRELPEGETHRAARALLELRPQRAPADALVAQADAQRPAGYRLAGSFEPGEEDAAAVAGFRIQENLAWGDRKSTRLNSSHPSISYA